MNARLAYDELFLAASGPRDTTPSEVLAVLSAGTAHDVNNLLLVAMGHLDLLANGRGELKRALNAANTALSQAVQLNARLMELARGQVSNPSGDAIAALRNLEHTLPVGLGSQISFEVQLPALAAETTLDTVSLGQVIWSLALNARDFMPDGGSLILRGWLTEAHLWIELRDTGRGIAAHHLPRIFEPYFTTKTRGSGLGLAVAKALVERSGGRIEAESREGEGTTFRLVLPLVA